MKMPEEIKKGLENCCAGICSGCPYGEECEKHLAGGGDMIPADVVFIDDALAYIQQLERERDAAVRDLEANKRCETCMYYTPDYFCLGCRNGSNWQWRGVREVE